MLYKKYLFDRKVYKKFVVPDVHIILSLEMALFLKVMILIITYIQMILFAFLNNYVPHLIISSFYPAAINIHIHSQTHNLWNMNGKY